MAAQDLAVKLRIVLPTQQYRYVYRYVQIYIDIYICKLLPTVQFEFERFFSCSLYGTVSDNVDH